MRQPVQVLVYPVKATNSNWEYLLLHRTVSRGNFWQGVTGGVEEGEEILEAARRELVEETGLVPLKIQKVDYEYSFPVSDRWRYLYAVGVEEITEYVFVAYVDDQQHPIIDSREHDKRQWCGFNQALELLTWPGNIEALKQCNNFLRSHSSLE
jgi:dihydroneopterin triphosphate diphosphatase